MPNKLISARAIQKTSATHCPHQLCRAPTLEFFNIISVVVSLTISMRFFLVCIFFGKSLLDTDFSRIIKFPNNRGQNQYLPVVQYDSSEDWKMSLSKSSIISQQNLTAPNLENNYVYEFEDFRLDSAHLMLYRNNKTISLKPKVVETLVALVERRGAVISKDELMNRLWAESFVEESNLTQNIYLLRKTLGNCADGQPFIENFSRRGYRFNGEIKTPNNAELLIATHTKTQTVIEETVEHRTRRTWLMTTFAAVVVLGAIAFTIKNFMPAGNSSEAKNFAAPFQNFKLKRHTETGEVTSGIISPDGKFIAYTDKKGALWLKNTATDSSVKILPEAENTERHVAAISPDDNYIYFLNLVKDKKSEILKMSLFGGAVQQKIAEGVWSDMSLSPDGTQFSFIRSNTETGETVLIVANTDGTGERKVVSNKAGTWFEMWSQPTAWSPDGSQIACAGGVFFDGKVTRTIKIFRVLDGKEVSTIKSDASWRWIASVAWLPEGDNLLVIGGDQSSDGQIYKYSISKGEWRRVTNDLSEYVHLSATADGKTIITTQQENPGNLWILPSDGDANAAKQITFGRNLLTDATGVSWTPDGKIVYATNAGGRWEIWTIDADGANQKQLTQNCAGNDSCSQPFVSPDGSFIVFQANRNGVRNIWRMDADGANPVQLTFDGGTNPAFSPDGASVIYTKLTSPAYTLWQVSLTGGEERQFSKISTAANATFSPDGKQMAFAYYDKQAKQPFQTCVAAIEAAKPEKCFDISRSFPRWTADGTAFYYLDHGYKGIWRQPLDGKRELFLEFAGERTNNFAFSPDGKQLVLARSRPTQDIVALTDEH